MKKILVFAIAASALLFVACNKEISVQVSPASVEKTFTVIAPSDTKTALSGTKTVVWSADDEINVIAKTSGNQYAFKLTQGAGTASAKFSGTLEAADAEETTFYAVYPNVAVRSASLANDKIELDKTLGQHQTAVQNGYDPNFAVLTGIVDDGAIAFRHGMAYFKIQIGTEGVYRVRLKSSNTRFAGRPVLVASTGDFSTIEGAKDTVSFAPASGTFAKDGVYYVPVPVKNSNLGTITVTYFFDAGNTISESLSNDTKAGVKLEVGKIYDLGCPNITYSTEPALTLLKSKVDNVASDAADGLTLESAYSLKNCTDGDVTVTPDGTVVTAASISGGTVTFSVSANTGEAREGSISLKLGAGEAQVITVKQVAAGAATELVNVTATTSWNATNTWKPLFTDKGGDAVKADFLYNNLGFVHGGGSGFKFADARVQLAGSGSAGTKCCIQFKVGGPGTVTVSCQSSNSSSDRTLKVALGSSAKGDISAPGASQNTDSVELGDAKAGDLVNIYSGGSGINVFEIVWTPAS